MYVVSCCVMSCQGRYSSSSSILISYQFNRISSFVTSTTKTRPLWCATATATATVTVVVVVVMKKKRRYTTTHHKHVLSHHLTSPHITSHHLTPPPILIHTHTTWLVVVPMKRRVRIESLHFTFSHSDLTRFPYDISVCGLCCVLCHGMSCHVMEMGRSRSYLISVLSY